jgi:hypothetical protein
MKRYRVSYFLTNGNEIEVYRKAQFEFDVTRMHIEQELNRNEFVKIDDDLSVNPKQVTHFILKQTHE